MNNVLRRYDSSKYLFHGSPNRLELLEPRQAKIFNKDSRRMDNHGTPAVSATPYLAVAIFRAVYNRQNAGGNDYRSAFSSDGKGNLTFKVTPMTYQRANREGVEGYVYVLQKKDFKKLSPMEWRSQKIVKPIAMIKVRASDMPLEVEQVEKF